MPIPTDLSDLDTVAANNYPVSTETLSTTDDYLRAHASILKKISTGANALTTPALGTPASGTLTNCTGLPVGSVTGLGTGIGTFLATPSSANLAAALTDETGSGALVFATSPTLVTPTLGVASATSVNKVAITAPATASALTIADGKTLTASNTLSLAGTDSTTITFQGTDTYVGRTTTDTLTNKRITPRVGSTTSSATPTINTDNVDIYKLTAQTADITSFTTNLSGTPSDGQALVIQITGTAARAITWGTSFEASTVALPTTTVSTNMLTVGFLYNSVTSKWRCVGSV